MRLVAITLLALVSCILGACKKEPQTGKTQSLPAPTKPPLALKTNIDLETTIEFQSLTADWNLALGFPKLDDSQTWTLEEGIEKFKKANINSNTSKQDADEIQDFCAIAQSLNLVKMAHTRPIAFNSCPFERFAHKGKDGVMFGPVFSTFVFNSLALDPKGRATMTAREYVAPCFNRSSSTLKALNVQWVGFSIKLGARNLLSDETISKGEYVCVVSSIQDISDFNSSKITLDEFIGRSMVYQRCGNGPVVQVAVGRQ